MSGQFPFTNIPFNSLGQFRRARSPLWRSRPGIEPVGVVGAAAVLVLAGCGSDREEGVQRRHPQPRRERRPGHQRRRPAGENGDQTQIIRDAINGSGARNVIMLLGDGMGDSEITIARNYEKGAGGSFAGLDAFPMTGQYTTFALNKDGKPNYVTDSAASATGWSTGTKTYNGALGIDIKGHRRRRSSSSPRTRASPPATSPHRRSRTRRLPHCSPTSASGTATDPKRWSRTAQDETLEKGGKGSVTEQLLATRPDVTMGGGAETFAQTATGRRLSRQDPRGAGQGARVTRSSAPQANWPTSARPIRTLRCSACSPTATCRCAGPDPPRCGRATCSPPPSAPTTPSAAREVPKLADMTTKAIELLAARTEGAQNRAKGFFLQVEGASIDKRDHAADAVRPDR